eukprot:COSAG02_NODE_1572_length_11882_cov_12.033353_6_plen_92_part_00
MTNVVSPAMGRLRLCIACQQHDATSAGRKARRVLLLDMSIAASSKFSFMLERPSETSSSRSLTSLIRDSVSLTIVSNFCGLSKNETASAPQ